MSENSERFGDLLEAEIESVKLETDTNGYIRVMFSDEELKEINSYLTTELTTTYNDYLPIWANAVENLETYKAIRMTIPESGPAIYPAPLARIPADQVIASTYNDVVRPRPIFAWDAYLNAQYDVPQAPQPTPPPQPGQPPTPPPPIQAAKMTAEDIAKRLRQGYEFIVRERIQFPKKLLKAVGSAVKGCPYYWKVSARPNESTKLVPKVAGAIVDLDDKYESTRMRGDIVQHELVPFFNFMKPLDQDEIETSPWCGERTTHRPDEIIKRWAAKELFLLEDEEEAKKLASDTADLFDPYRARAASTTEKKTPQTPTQVCDVWLTWFYWTVRYKSKDDGQTHVKRMNLIGDFHRTGGKMMNCFVNQYEHQERPYEIIDQMDDGGSTVENMRYHQTVFTHCTQAEIKNAFHANNFLKWYDPFDTTLEAFFKANTVLSSGDSVPGEFGKAWGVARMGAEHYSLLEFMKFVLTMSQLDSKQNKYTSGDPGGRTPAYTMKQALQQAGEEPNLFLHRLSNKFSRIMRLDAETRRQFQPLGEVLPMWDDEAKKTVEVPFQLPVGDVLDNFRCALTASDEALAQEQDPQVIMAKKQALMTDGEYIAKVLTPILNTQTPIPPELVAIFAKIIRRDQKALMELIGSTTTEEDAYDLTKELDAFIDARNKQVQMQQQMDMEIKHAQMQNGGQAQQGPAPQIKVSLKGELTPAQEDAAAQALGIGGTSAQMPPTGSQGAVPPGGPGNPGGPPQPGGQPAIPPRPIEPPPQGGGIGAQGLVQ